MNRRRFDPRYRVQRHPVIAVICLFTVVALLITLNVMSAFASKTGAGRYVKGFGAEDFNGQGFWLGAYEAPGNTESQYPVWCTHMFRANPQPEDTATIATLTDSSQWGPPELDLTVAQMAWLLNKYQGDADNANTRAALSYLIHANFERQQGSRSTQDSVMQMVTAVRNSAADIDVLAQKFVAEARKAAPISYQAGKSDSHGARRGSLKNIGIPTAEGFVAGVPVTITLKGPAVFDSTGTARWTGLTASTPLSVSWRSTGNGEVTAQATFTGLARRTLTIYGVNEGTQDTLSYGNRPHSDPDQITIPGDTWRVIFDFQPIATSQVGESKIVDGKDLTDSLTASADPQYGDGRWIEFGGAPVPITFEGTAYWTGEKLPAHSLVPPDTATVLGSTSLIFNGPGTQTASLQLTEEAPPGFITWVWKVNKSAHTQILTEGTLSYPVSEFIHADWSDGFGLADETTSLRSQLSIDTAISPRYTQHGTYLVDDIFVTGFPEDHTDFVGGLNFTADSPHLKQDLLFFPEALPVLESFAAQAEVIASITLPARNGFYPSVGSTKFKVKEGNPPGTYVFVTSFDGDDRVRSFRTKVTDMTEQFTVEGPIPELKTTATNALTGDKNIPSHGKVRINDHVCYTNLKPGKEYDIYGTLMDRDSKNPVIAGGAPVTAHKKLIPAHSQGCTDVEFSVDAKHLMQRTTVVFEELKSDGRTLAIHADLNDEGQTIPSPEAPTVSTTATGLDKKSKTIFPVRGASVVDHVCYSHLRTDTAYTLIGTLMVRETGKPLTDAGKIVTSSKEFIPKFSEGCVDLEFTFDARALAKKQLVVFEDIFSGEVLIVSHADMDDEGQTVTVETSEEPPPFLARTGISTMIPVATGVALVLMGTLLLRCKRSFSSKTLRKVGTP